MCRPLMRSLTLSEVKRSDSHSETSCVISALLGQQIKMTGIEGLLYYNIWHVSKLKTSTFITSLLQVVYRLDQCKPLVALLQFIPIIVFSSISLLVSFHITLCLTSLFHPLIWQLIILQYEKSRRSCLVVTWLAFSIPISSLPSHSSFTDWINWYHICSVASAAAIRKKIKCC